MPEKFEVHQYTNNLFTLVSIDTTCLVASKKITKYAKRQEKKSEETKQPLESDMTQVLESSGREFKITMIDI